MANDGTRSVTEGAIMVIAESEDDRALRLIQEQKQAELRNFGRAFRKECEDTTKEIPE